MDTTATILNLIAVTFGVALVWLAAKIYYGNKVWDLEGQLRYMNEINSSQYADISELLNENLDLSAEVALLRKEKDEMGLHLGTLVLKAAGFTEVEENQLDIELPFNVIDTSDIPTSELLDEMKKLD